MSEPCEEPIQAPPDPDGRQGLQAQVGEWGARTFPQSTPKSILAHLRREVEELNEVFTNPPSFTSRNANIAALGEEAADCYLLLLHLAHRVGFDLQERAAWKFGVNQGRTWGPVDGDGVSEHLDEASRMTTPPPFTPDPIDEAVAERNRTTGSAVVTRRDGLTWEQYSDRCDFVRQQLVDLGYSKAERAIGYVAVEFADQWANERHETEGSHGAWPDASETALAGEGISRSGGVR